MCLLQGQVASLSMYKCKRAGQDSAAWVEDYQLELLEGVSHWVQEQEPDTVNRLIENFIK